MRFHWETVALALSLIHGAASAQTSPNVTQIADTMVRLCLGVERRSLYGRWDRRSGSVAAVSRRQGEFHRSIQYQQVQCRRACQRHQRRVDAGRCGSSRQGKKLPPACSREAPRRFASAGQVTVAYKYKADMRSLYLHYRALRKLAIATAFAVATSSQSVETARANTSCDPGRFRLPSTSAITEQDRAPSARQASPSSNTIFPWRIG